MTPVDLKDPEPLLIPAVEKQPEHEWEGEFVGETGTAKDYVIRFKTMLGIHGELVEGAGRLTDVNGETVPEIVNCTFTGSAFDANIHAEFWFDTDEPVRKPIVCVGVIDAKETEITGSWTMECFDPVECKCGGAGGSFSMRRVQV